MIPIDELIFFRGVETTNQIYIYLHIYIYLYIYVCVHIYIYIYIRNPQKGSKSNASLSDNELVGFDFLVFLGVVVKMVKPKPSQSSLMG